MVDKAKNNGINTTEEFSDEVHEIFSHIPHWITRWGITSIFIVLLMLVTATTFISYPDTISSSIMVTTKVPPVSVMSRSSGHVDLFVEDGQLVKAGEMLGVIQNTADTEDVFWLLERLSALKMKLMKKNVNIISVDLKTDLALGDLQGAWLLFLKNIEDLKQYLGLNALQEQIDGIEERLARYEYLNGKLYDLSDMMKEEFQVVKRRYEIDSTLYAQQFITPSDYSIAQESFLKAKRSFESNEIDLVNSEIQVSQLRASMIQLQLTRSEQLGNYLRAIEASLNELQAGCETWKQNYLLESPVAGKISMIDYWSDFQYANAGDEILVIVPQSTEIVGFVYVPIAGSGKVKPGQTVNIRFDNYPSEQYGMVQGIVSSISLVPREEQYTVRILIPNGLVTHYGNRLPFKQEMRGSADIVTEDLKLFDRIFSQLKSILNNS